jgi:hypothetical protein
MDKDFIKVYSYHMKTFSPLFAVLLAVLWFVFGIPFVVFMLGAVFLFVIGAFFFALTAPIWAALAALVYAAVLAVCLPFYNLYAAFRKTHKDS